MQNEVFERARYDRIANAPGATLISARAGGVVVVNELGEQMVGILLGDRGARNVTWRKYETAEMSFQEAIEEISAWNKTDRQEVSL